LRPAQGAHLLQAEAILRTMGEFAVEKEVRKLAEGHVWSVNLREASMLSWCGSANLRTLLAYY
jgi:hypothetical protein